MPALETIHSVEMCVLKFYIDTGVGLSVPEIASQVSFGETTIRKVVQASPKLELTHKYVQIMSQRHPQHIHQNRSIDAYQPTRRWLREIIQGLRVAKSYDGYLDGGGAGFGGRFGR